MSAPDRLTIVRSADRPRSHGGTSAPEAAIFDATEQLLAEIPLHDLSVAQIIAAAGVSRATFYFYFSSKFAVLSGLLARTSDAIFEVVQPFVQREESVAPEEALRQSLSATVGLWATHRPALQAIHEHWNATDGLRALWISVVERFTEATVSELERQREAGLTRFSGDLRALAAGLVWSTESCLYVAGLGVEPNLPDEQGVLPTLLAMWTSVLYG